MLQPPDQHLDGGGAQQNEAGGSWLTAGLTITALGLAAYGMSALFGDKAGE